ncbi:hypothetical protein CLAFUW4_08020, partial [Fulvia fulva]
MPRTSLADSKNPGMFGMDIKQEGIEIQGDQVSFAHWTHIWRRVLELIHDAHAGETPADSESEVDEDHIVGRYVYINAGPIWGRYWSGTHINTKDSYVACIAAMIKKLNLNKPIVCGASMAGQISLACAVRAKEVGCVGTIALQGSDYLNMDRQFNDKSPYVNQSLFNPEWIYGMMSPTAPLKNRQLIWHMYSAEAYGIFHGDLDFYFGGWDGRSRMAGIDTKVCPVYMETCDKIPGAKHQAMKGLGHFPATENPKVFVGYVLEAIYHIQKTRAEALHLEVVEPSCDRLSL